VIFFNLLTKFIGYNLKRKKIDAEKIKEYFSVEIIVL
jgi:hypothetical protein